MTQLGKKVVGTVLLAAAVSAASGAMADDAKFQTVTPGVLTVATELGNPGWMNGTDPNNVQGGVEWAMANAFAKEWGIPKVVFKNVAFTPLISGTVTGYDIGLMVIFRTEARQKVNKYSDCYYNEESAALVKKGTRLDDLADARKLQWGHVTGGYAGLIMQKLQPEKTPKSFQDGPTEYNALLSGTIDAVLDDLSSVAGRAHSKGFEGTEVAAVVALKGVPPACGAVQLPMSAPDSNVAAVNEAIAKLEKSGEMAKWKAEYLGPNGVDASKYKRIEVE
jgi:ABC-type amino acid transport substrate-binding protein